MVKNLTQIWKESFLMPGLKVYLGFALFYLNILVLINGYNLFRLYCKIINKDQSFNRVLEMKSMQGKGTNIWALDTSFRLLSFSCKVTFYALEQKIAYSFVLLKIVSVSVSYGALTRALFKVCISYWRFCLN